MNTHRVHLKATRSHFTASGGFLLPQVTLLFNAIYKKGKILKLGSIGESGPYLREELANVRKINTTVQKYF